MTKNLAWNLITVTEIARTTKLLQVFLNIARSLQHCKSKSVSYLQLSPTITIPPIWSSTPVINLLSTPRRTITEIHPITTQITDHYEQMTYFSIFSIIQRWNRPKVFRVWKRQNKFKKGTYYLLKKAVLSCNMS